VISVLGQFLEHARIYYFKNGGNEEYYIGSSDLMKRSLEGRVEVLAPVENLKLRQELRLMLDIQLSSKKHSWAMQQDGHYDSLSIAGETETSAQETFIRLAGKRKVAAAKHQQAKLRKKLLTHFHKRLQDEGKGASE
jgi:polyphosphate kinase